MAYILDRMMFIHIPKCGGHTVWNVMRDNGGFRCKDHWPGGFMHHQSAVSIRQKMGSKFDNYQKIALVRNPWERAVSLYFGRNKLDARHDVKGFGKFLVKYTDLSKFRWNPHYPVSRMVDPSVLVFDLSEIDRLWHWMEANLDIKVGTPEIRRSGWHRNVERLPYREYYDDRLRDWIARDHQKDIERWGWKF